MPRRAASFSRTDVAKDTQFCFEAAARLLRAAQRGEGRRVARFILVALYTGSRHAVLKLRWVPSIDAGWVDLDQGVIYRKGRAESQSSKRRSPVPISPRLAAHLRRWKAEGGIYVVSWGR
jgi:hypothetical protein